jgi:type IV pilus assembly protein PilQ
MKLNRVRLFLPVVLLALAFASASNAAENKPPKPVLRVLPNPDGRISLDVKDADIRDVLRIFEMLTKKNFAVDPEVKGSVTMRLEDVRWQDALDVVLRSNGFAAEIEGRIVRVATPAKLAGEKP